MTILKNIISGLILVAIVMSFAFVVSHYSGFNVILLALLIGILVGNSISVPTNFTPGIKWSSNHFLEFAIVFLAFGINYQVLLNLGWQSIAVVVLSMVSLLIFTRILAIKLKCPGSTGWLIGFGTGICGSAAIAALAPGVSKDKSDIGIALAVVNLLGLVGMIGFPMLIPTFGLSDAQAALLIGGSLHSMGNVAGAGMAIGGDIGEMSIAIKLGRIALLTPALLFFRFLLNKGNSTASKETIKLTLPWYLWAFIAISIITTLVVLPSTLISFSKSFSNILLAAALGAIGLSVSFKSLLQNGKKGILFGAIIFAVYLILLGLFSWIFLSL